MQHPVRGLSTTQTGTSPLACIECLRTWVSPTERWRLKVTDDPAPEAVLYCPDCAAREFGPAR